jgi:4'-phosphopantetheinyl transferase
MSRRPYEIVFKLSETGKPSIVEPSPSLPQRIQFNLTGSRDLALVAVSVDYPVGVDCELIRPGPDFLGIARRMFPPRVADTLEGTPLESRPEVFYAAWTALEAEVKADGRGLFRAPEPSALPLTTAHCVPQPGYLAAVARHRLPPPSSWQGFEWLPPP